MDDVERNVGRGAASMCSVGMLHRLTYFASILELCASNRLENVYVDCDLAADVSERIKYTKQRLLREMSGGRWSTIGLDWNRQCHGFLPPHAFLYVSVQTASIKYQKVISSSTQ